MVFMVFMVLLSFLKNYFCGLEFMFMVFMVLISFLSIMEHQSPFPLVTPLAPPVSNVFLRCSIPYLCFAASML
jgi:hypothetical protein